MKAVAATTCSALGATKKCVPSARTASYSATARFTASRQCSLVHSHTQAGIDGSNHACAAFVVAISSLILRNRSWFRATRSESSDVLPAIAAPFPRDATFVACRSGNDKRVLCHPETLFRVHERGKDHSPRGPLAVFAATTPLRRTAGATARVVARYSGSGARSVTSAWPPSKTTASTTHSRSRARSVSPIAGTCAR
jgi:hypothetical protein